MPYRYNLDLPDTARARLKEAADARGISVAELLRKFINLGLLTLDIERDPDAALLIRQAGRERQLVLL